MLSLEKEFNVKKNYSVVFCGITDHQYYLMDVNDSGSYHHNTAKGGQWLVIVTEDSIKILGLPSLKKKHRLRLKQSDSDEYYVQSGHFLRVRGSQQLIKLYIVGMVILSTPVYPLCVHMSHAVLFVTAPCSKPINE